jgi:hypothetical protein
MKTAKFLKKQRRTKLKATARTTTEKKVEKPQAEQKRLNKKSNNPKKK